MKTTDGKSTEIAVFGGGCFWCTEAVFQMLRGVQSVVPGYTGGHNPAPTYEEVSTGASGYAEVVQIQYDPQQVTFEELLNVFFKTHDPTSPNRQGNDVGPQYRSVIFYTNETQKHTAQKYIAMLTHSYEKPIVTQVLPLTRFYQAEDYHVDYYRNNQNSPYCQFVIRPKIDRVKAQFNQLLK